MSFWTLENIRHSCGGRWVAGVPTGGNAVVGSGVSIDSRAVGHGQVFMAIAGERHDGHAFATQAAGAGAAMLIVERPVDGCASVAVALVPSTRRALLALAAAYRARLKATVIAVCGSNGKTTTVRLIDAALRGGGLRGTASVKSFNNDVGVPLTILSAHEDDRYLICEVGSNAPGEIGALGAIVKPDVAVVTSIGREHLEGFKNIEGVAREEASILRHLRPGGLAVLTGDAPVLRRFGGDASRVAWFGASERCHWRFSGAAHAMVEVRDSQAARKAAEQAAGGVAIGLGVRLTFTAHVPLGAKGWLAGQGGLAGEAGAGGGVGGGVDVSLPMPGTHNASNAMAALAVAHECGVVLAGAVAGLARAEPPEMRLNVSRVLVPGGGELVVVNDAYNANPESVLAAINTAQELAKVGAGGGLRLVLVLGDMLELGEAEASSHDEVLSAAVSTGGRVVVIGPRFASAVGRWAVGRSAVGLAGAADVEAFPTIDEAAIAKLVGWLAALAGGPRAGLSGARGVLVLVKASRGMRLERVVRAIELAGTAADSSGSAVR